VSTTGGAYGGSGAQGPSASGAPGADPGRPTRRPAQPPPDPERLMRTAVRFYGVVLLAALAWRWGWAGESLLFASPAAAARGVRLLPDLLLGLAAGGAVIALSHVATQRTGWGDRLARALAGSLGRLELRHVLVLALTSGIAEEAFFRGALQPQVGYVAAGLIFGLVHFIPRREFLPWTGFSIAAGFLLGGLYAWTGNLLAPTVAHVLVNAVNLHLLCASKEARESGGPGDDVDLDAGVER